jgi:hypothetical protein
VVEHGGAVVVAEADALQLELAAHLMQGLGVAVVGSFHGFGLDRPQALQGCLALLELVEVGGEVGDRVDQHQQSRHIAAQPLTVELAALDAPGADQQHREDAEGLQEAHNGMLQGQQAQGAIAGAAMLLHLMVEALLQPWFGGIGPHQGKAGDGLSQQTRQFAHLALAAFGRRHHPGAEAAHEQGDQGGQQQGGQGQRPVEPEHRGQNR